MRETGGGGGGENFPLLDLLQNSQALLLKELKGDDIRDQISWSIKLISVCKPAELRLEKSLLLKAFSREG